MTEGEPKKSKLEDGQQAHEAESKPLGRIVHSEPLQHRPLSVALGRLPEPDLKK